MTYCSTYLANITLIITNFISQSQVARRTESTGMAGKQQRPLGLDLEALWSSRLASGQMTARSQRVRGRSINQIMEVFLIFVQYYLCMFHGIENVKKSRVTKDSDCLEILSEAVKWKDCDKNWKRDHLSVNMPTIQRYIWRFYCILTIYDYKE